MDAALGGIAWEAIFVDDMVNAFRGRCLAMVDDARLLGRDWGFRLADVKVPVRWWHGDADNFVPLGAAEHAVSRLAHGVPLQPGTWASIRASELPAQVWMPKPNAGCT